jgi:hypothetical protein
MVCHRFMVAVSCGDAMINQYLALDFLLKISTLPLLVLYHIFLG